MLATMVWSSSIKLWSREDLHIRLRFSVQLRQASVFKYASIVPVEKNVYYQHGSYTWSLAIVGVRLAVDSALTNTFA